MSFAPLNIPANWATGCQTCGNAIVDIDDVRISYDRRAGSSISCVQCFNNLFVSCESCQETDVRSQMSSTDLGGSVCSECQRDSYVTCSDTNISVHQDRAIQIGGSWFSPQAAARWATCTACQQTIRSTDAQTNGGVCTRCLRTVIREYSTRAETNLSFLAIPTSREGENLVTADKIKGYGKSQGLRYYGVELEVEHNAQNSRNIGLYQTAKEISDQFQSFAIIKRDSSLRHGFEIVTAPATYEVHKAYWDSFFKNYKERDQVSSYFTTTCGMHIHISRASLTPLQIGKMLVFIYSNKNTKFISTISQRSSARYNNFSNPKTFIDAFGGDWITREQRYTAVNLLNPNTVEVRLFKGTVSKDKFFKNLEFVKALVDYCETGVASMKDCETFEGFCAYVQRYATTYPYLFRFLVQANYCKFKSKKPENGAKRNFKAKLKKNAGKGKDVLIAIDRVIPYVAPAPAPIYTYNNSRTRTAYFVELRRQRDIKFASKGAAASAAPQEMEANTREAIAIFNAAVYGDNNIDFEQFRQSIIALSDVHSVTYDEYRTAHNIINARHADGTITAQETNELSIAVCRMAMVTNRPVPRLATFPQEQT